MPPEQPIEIPEEAFAALESLRETLEAVAPGAYGLGVGLKETDGDITDEVALRVYVPEKLPIEEVPEDQRIPPEVSGFPTDVVVRQWQLDSDDTFHRTVVGGIQVGHKRAVPRPDGTFTSETSAGTLGVLVRRRSNGQLMGLTNCHVARSNESEPLAILTQPAGGGQFGQVRENKIGGKVDCALVDLPQPPARPRRLEVADLGLVRGSGRMRFLWQPVKKRGAVTGVTRGRTLSTDLPVKLKTRRDGWEQDYVITDQIEIVGEPPTLPWSASGDSGSVVLTVGVPELGIDDNVVIGLHCGHHTATLPDGRTIWFGVANRIDNVLTELEVDIAIAPSVTSVTPNSAVGSVATLGNVVVEGFGFDGSPQVVFGETPAIVLSSSDTRLEVIMPLHLPGVVDVRVTNDTGETSDPVDASKFTYEPIV